MRVTDLQPLDVACAAPVYRGRAEDGSEVFVKVTDRAAIARTKALLKAAGTCPLVPPWVEADVPALAGRDYLCLAWRDARRVDAEKMSDAQADGLLAGYLDFARAVQSAEDLVPLGEDDPDALFGVLEEYARRHPLAGRVLRPLLGLPASARRLAGHPLVTVHGDLQPKNYGFSGDRLSAVFDLDTLTKGLACEDLAYAFTERARRSELPASARRRLEALFVRVVRASPWPADAWRVAVNHARLRIAARRLLKRPNSALIVLDVYRRDRPLAALARALDGLDKGK